MAFRLSSPSLGIIALSGMYVLGCTGGSGGASSAPSPPASAPTTPMTPTAPTPALVEPTLLSVSAGPTAVGRPTVNPSLAFSTGTLVRFEWSSLEPAPGTFVWQAFDDEVAAAAAIGQKVSLMIVNGPHAPAWLYQPPYSVPGFSYLFRGSTPFTMPLPWDATYLDRWTQVIAAFGARYDGNPTVQLVHMSHSTVNGAEMHLNMSPHEESSLRAAGYTDGVYAASWNEVLDAFAAAFPRTALDHDVHPIFHTDVVAQAVTDHGHATIGARYGVAAWWFSRPNAQGIYAGMHTLVKRAAQTSFATLQLVSNATNDPAAFGSYGTGDELAALQDVLEFARSELGADVYIEVWPEDLRNTAFASYLGSLGY